MANALAPIRRVVLVYLKDGPGVDANLDARVEEILLVTTPGGWRGRLRVYQRLLRDAGGRENVASLSMCFSADLFNRFCSEDAVICSSVRGNLPQNYQHDYGMIGTSLAIAHLLALRSFDHVFAMTEAMATQIHSIAGVRSKIIGNFVDEQALECFRSASSYVKGGLHFVYVGSLTNRKQPALIVHAIEFLISQGYEVKLDVIGDGPLRESISATVVRNGLQEHVQLHGQVANPYPLIAGADALILPSRSEGVSRAALEALHLGVPCVLRDVDGNAELLSDPMAGKLFSSDIDLSRAMIEAASLGRTRSIKSSLLPPSFRQSTAAMQYLQLIEGSV
ncbi:glycosyltransferase [Ferribacterium limneticum]|uniref:glycosyltransferase n=1 Tax=Ferribacterium limneticum TaxID=76259 RepID=UPI001CF9819B|nr:glycosyltransferase [Ferribacterium limneticum]UCV28956.1 glycosyltransferase [Ferribacterium limneticum]UCV32874.1 glycosyltransferase [Ferribacterium limneticum]